MAGHILLAEDDKALSALMQDFFRAAGVTVTPAYDLSLIHISEPTRP